MIPHPHQRPASLEGMRTVAESPKRPPPIPDDRRTVSHRAQQPSRFRRLASRAASVMHATRRRQLAIFLLGCALGFAVANVLGRRKAQPVPLVVLSSSVDDDPFLGSQETFEGPGRLSSYVYKHSETVEMYDKTWTEGAYPRKSCWGCRFAPDVVQRLKFHTVLDAGCGNGELVRLLRRHGKNAFGVELSRAVLEQESPDLLKQGIVEQGDLSNLPYETNAFDLVFSADVLEHILPGQADAVVRELVRVTRRHLVLSISLKSHVHSAVTEGGLVNRHTMLRARAWWEGKFREHGAVVNRELVWALQEKNSVLRRDEMRDCRWEGSESDGGTYEVCVVDHPWLVGQVTQANLRYDRCVTPADGELEPWIFAFRKLR